MNMPALSPRVIALTAAGAGIALFLIAHAHLVYVAVVSQPECVAHLKTESQAPGAYRAARSSC